MNFNGVRRWFLADHLIKNVPAQWIRFFRSEVLNQWKLDQNDVSLLSGDREGLTALLQDRYDFSIRRSQTEVDDFFQPFQLRIERATDKRVPPNDR